MPSPYVAAGIIGGLALLGFAVWTLFTQNQRYEHHGGGYNGTNFNPEPGYDRPRDDVDDLDSGPGRRRRNRRREGREECPICQEPLSSGEFIRRLPCSCGNRFHDACITQWFKVQRTCPICRNNLHN